MSPGSDDLGGHGRRSRRRRPRGGGRRRSRRPGGLLPPRGRPKRGDAREELWRHLVGELGGEIAYDRRGKPQHATIPHRAWLLVLDQHTESAGETSRTVTRVRALFTRDGPFRLRVTRRNPFHRLAWLVGFRPVDIGYHRVDRSLFVRSDRADVARQMLRGTSLGQALISGPRLTLKVKPPARHVRRATHDSAGEVEVSKSGKVKELSVLRMMAQAVMWTLDELARARVATGAAVEDAAI